MPADVDESVLPGETADDYVVRVASDKATAVAMALAAPPDSRSPDSRSLDAATDRGADSSGPTVVLAADTAVVLDGEPLGKPRDRADALAMLSRLSGRNHRVLSAVVVVDPDGVVHTALATATVTIAPSAAQSSSGTWTPANPWTKPAATRSRAWALPWSRASMVIPRPSSVCRCERLSNCSVQPECNGRRPVTHDLGCIVAHPPA